MPTLFRVGSWRVVIYLNDHEPAHVHVNGPEGHARFSLGRDPGDVALLETDGIPTPILRRVAAQLIDRHAECLSTWSAIHGHQVTDRPRR